MNDILLPDDAKPRRSIWPGLCPLVVLYVSTDLQVIWMHGRDAQLHARDLVSQEDDGRRRRYRRLDLLFWVWIEARLAVAHQAHAAGQLDDARWSHLQEQAALLATWIAQHYPQHQVAAARVQGTRSYVPPCPVRSVA